MEKDEPRRWSRALAATTPTTTSDVQELRVAVYETRPCGHYYCYLLSECLARVPCALCGRPVVAFVILGRTGFR